MESISSIDRDLSPEEMDIIQKVRFHSIVLILVIDHKSSIFIHLYVADAHHKSLKLFLRGNREVIR